MTDISKSRRERGRAMLDKVNPTAAAAQAAGLDGTAPELADFINDFAFGEVLSRPGLPIREREMATVAALTALGNARPQLVAHIDGALNVGCTPREVVEIILQMAVYAGFPAALNGMSAAKEVFDRRGIRLEAARLPD